jgi:hypothetical protein
LPCLPFWHSASYPFQDSCNPQDTCLLLSHILRFAGRQGTEPPRDAGIIMAARFPPLQALWLGPVSVLGLCCVLVRRQTAGLTDGSGKDQAGVNNHRPRQPEGKGGTKGTMPGATGLGDFLNL